MLAVDRRRKNLRDAQGEDETRLARLDGALAELREAHGRRVLERAALFAAPVVACPRLRPVRPVSRARSRSPRRVARRTTARAGPTSSSSEPPRRRPVARPWSPAWRRAAARGPPLALGRARALKATAPAQRAPAHERGDTDEPRGATMTSLARREEAIRASLREARRL